MVIISDKKSEIEVKIPNNFKKSGNILNMRNTETKKEYVIEFEDVSENDHYYIFSHIFSYPAGEYEYTIDENKGLLRIEDKITKKIYDEGISFKTYEDR